MQFTSLFQSVEPCTFRYAGMHIFEQLLGRVLARWRNMSGLEYPSRLLKHVTEMLNEYYNRLTALGRLNVEAFEEDAFQVMQCYASCA
jgi:hypothetical protein